MPATATAEGGFTMSIDTSGTTLSGSMTLNANLVLTAALGTVGTVGYVPSGTLLLPSYHPCALSIVRAGSLPRLLGVFS